MSKFSILFMAIAFLCVEGADWHEPTADYRIQLRLEGKRTTSCFVRLPKEFQEWKGVACYGESGRVVCRPVIIQEKMVAVELTLRGPASQVVMIYPLAGPGKPVVPGLVSPVSCYYAGDKLVARPANGEGMRQCNLTHPKLKFYRCLPQMPVKTYGLHLFYKFQNQRVGKNFSSLKIRARLSSHLVARTPMKIQFSLNNLNSGPWYLFVDGKAVFSWGNCDLIDGVTPASKEIALDVGIHTLDLFAFPDYGENFPELRARFLETHDFSALPTSMLFSSIECRCYRIDHREKGIVCNFRLMPELNYFYRETNRYDLGFYLVDVTPKGGVSYTINGKSLNFDSGFAELELNSTVARLVVDLPASSPIKRLEFPVVGDPFVCKERIIRLRVTDLPLFEPVAKPLVVRYAVEVDNGKGHLPPHSTVHVRTYSKKTGLHVEKSIGVPVFPNKRVIQIERRDADVERLELQLFVGDVPASNVVPIHFVRSQAGLKFPDDGGRFLHFDKGLAVLRRQSGELTPTDVTWKGTIGKIGLVDGFISNVKHPYESYSFETFDWGALDMVHLPIRGDRDNHFLTDKFRRLNALKSDAMSMLLFAPSFAEMNELDLRDLREHAMYLIKAVRASGKQIGFVTPPALSRLDPEKLRSYVLTLKELGRSFDFPVVDLYSASRGKLDMDAYWNWADTQPAPARTAVPNSRGQEWIFKEITKALENKKWK